MHVFTGSMTFGRKQFRRNDVLSNATIGRYDVPPTTTFRRLRQLVENSSNYVEIWSKTDSYGKNKKLFTLFGSHISNIFSRQCHYGPAVYINFVLKIHQIQVLTEPLCRAQASFYALPNNERGTKYRGLIYSARQNCP